MKSVSLGIAQVLKCIKSGYVRATVPYPKNLEVLTQRIDAQTFTHDTLEHTLASSTFSLSGSESEI